ncbi:NAD(P)/FAD-dependent oxidoreductase [Thermodesulfobacteriota bacterium]
MAQTYDLIVVGAGPAGLMAAKTAGENGLRVALIERKKTIADINRACSMMVVTLTGEYLGDRVTLNTRDKRLCFPGYGFSVRYDGPHQNFYSWTIYSHKANKIQLGDYEKNSGMGDKGRVSATYDKSALLRCLLEDCVAANVDVYSGYNVIGSRTENGKVTVFTSSGTKFTGTFVIGADGRSSRLAKTLGKNTNRHYYGTNTSVGWEMTGVEPSEKYALFQIFLPEDPPMRIWMTPRANGEEHFAFVSCTQPGYDCLGAFDRFISEGPFASWFRNAEKTRALSAIGNMYSHIDDPYKDQVILISDAIWCQEAEMTGALISGWKAAGAVAFALAEGTISRKGVSGFLDWWRDEVINKLDHKDMIRNAVMPYCLTRDDIDYLLSKITRTLKSILDPYETPKIVGAAMAEIMPIVTKERPDVFQKLQTMRTDPLEAIFHNCIRGGFPTKMKSG